MSRPLLTSGAVIWFPYLWRREALSGETEGRKQRPTVVAFRLTEDLIWLFPITTKEPEAGRLAKEIPEIEKRRVKLDPDIRSWIILDEYNSDRIGSSTYLEPDCEIGAFSKAFASLVFRAWISDWRARKITGVERGEA